MSYFKLKCTKFDFSWQTPLGHRRKLLLGPEAQAPPLLWSWGSPIWRAPPLLWRDIVLIVFQLFVLVLRNADKSTVRPFIPCSARHFCKGTKFAGSVGHPMTKMLSASGGLCPQTPVIRSCSALAMVPPNHSPLPPPLILAPRAPPLILTSLRLWSRPNYFSCLRRHSTTTGLPNTTEALSLLLVKLWYFLFALSHCGA